MRFWDFILNVLILGWLIWGQFSELGWEQAGYVFLVAVAGACLGGRMTSWHYSNVVK